MTNEPYHNKGFGIAFFWIFTLVFILPIVGILSIDDTWERFVKKYTDPIRSECWENSKHERTCKGENTCKFGRNFCIKEIYRWKTE